MIFEVERISQWNHWCFDENKPPCDGAFVKEFEITKTTRNGPAVKKKIKRWFIELNTLEDLLAFKEENVEELIITYTKDQAYKFLKEELNGYDFAYWENDIEDITVNYRIEIYDIPRE